MPGTEQFEVIPPRPTPEQARRQAYEALLAAQHSVTPEQQLAAEIKTAGRLDEHSKREIIAFLTKERGPTEPVGDPLVRNRVEQLKTAFFRQRIPASLQLQREGGGNYDLTVNIGGRQEDIQFRYDGATSVARPLPEFGEIAAQIKAFTQTGRFDPTKLNDALNSALGDRNTANDPTGFGAAWNLASALNRELYRVGAGIQIQTLQPGQEYMLTPKNRQRMNHHTVAMLFRDTHGAVKGEFLYDLDQADSSVAPPGGRR
jgi:hypothetical protein